MKFTSTEIFTRIKILATICRSCRNLCTTKWVEPSGYNTGIIVYNPVTKAKVPLIVRSSDYASWYMCGPTVYDSAHIGHGCCYVRFDIIRRILTNFFNINVVLVMGITDVDDKIIKRAFDSQEDIEVLTRRYEKEFFADMASLNVLPPTVTVHVTNVIPQIVSFIENIVSNGLAYKGKDGSVYFDTTNYQNYGKLMRGVPDNNVKLSYKKSPLDFALWKNAKPDEPFWSSPWGNGRPGWHIECSVIASKILGSRIDLHSGGVDLLFPHHENEEAQSCVYHDVNQWVNYWLHSGHLSLRNEVKMSKSLKNTISIQKFLESNSSHVFRMYCLLSRYRNDLELTESALEQARVVFKKTESFLADCNAYVKGHREGNVIESELLKILEACKHRFTSALCDDFDTVSALASLSELITVGNKMLHSPATSNVQVGTNPGVVAAASSFIQQTYAKLGIQFESQEMVGASEFETVRILDATVEFRKQVREVALGNLPSMESSPHSRKNTNSKLLEVCDKLREDFRIVGIDIKDQGKMSSWARRKNI